MWSEFPIRIRGFAAVLVSVRCWFRLGFGVGFSAVFSVGFVRVQYWFGVDLMLVQKFI